MTNPPCDVYAERLFPTGYGHPLWVPEPDSHTGREVLVGDVGFLQQGVFMPLFNITKRADDPINYNGAPPAFRVVSAGDMPISRSHKLTQGIVCSAGMSAVEVEGGVTAVGGSSRFPPLASAWKLRCTTDAGAFVALDSPGVAENFESRSYIVNYMRENLDAWLKFANVTHGLGINDQGITGAIQDAGTHDMERRPSAGLQVRSLGPLGSLEFEGQTSPHCSYRTGPSLPETGPQNPPSACNQCLFIHYYKMKRRQSRSKVNGGQDGTMVGANGYEYEYEIEIESSNPSLDEPGYDPVGPLLDYILKNSKADIAIASDIDVTTLFRILSFSISKGETFPNSEVMSRAIAQLAPVVKVDQHGMGSISF